MAALTDKINTNTNTLKEQIQVAAMLQINRVKKRFDTTVDSWWTIG